MPRDEIGSRVEHLAQLPRQAALADPGNAGNRYQLHSLRTLVAPPKFTSGETEQHDSMRNLTFGFFDDSGLPRESRILMFYSFDTEENLPRSGILHYHMNEGRFVGPRHDRELTSAAMQFLVSNGRVVPSTQP
jgi:hypothetical protein